MRSPLHLALAVVVCAGGVTLPASAQAEDPEQLYKEGQADYANGDFKSAVTKLNKAYDLSGDPLMLYMIGQAYRDWYSESRDVDHLREAKITFEKFIVALQADPTLGDPADIKPEIDAIDEQIAEAEKNQAPEPEPEPEPDPAPTSQPDPGKPLKITGGVLLGTGGAAFLGGAAVGIAFGLKGLNLSDDIDGLRTQFADAGCDPDNPAAGQCADLQNDINATVDDGDRANLLTGVGWGIAGLGAVLAVTGGVLMAKGMRKSDVWRAEHAHLRLTPTFGGLMLSGRF
ncbi:MAG: hypothetical protein R3A79_11740 [Nannocystaceae bacterium]